MALSNISKKPFILLLIALLACTGLWMSGCAHEEAYRIPGRHSIAVMPFVKGRDPQNLAHTLSCPFANFCYEETELNPEADMIMTEMLHEKLMNRLEDRVFPLNLVRKHFPPLFYGRSDKTPLVIAVELGQNLGVDYVVVGNIWRYKKRIGSALGVDEPASVAFGLHLVDISNGKVVWRDSFNETQQSLAENILRALKFFKCGAKWLTARELARCGIEELLADFPL